MVAATADITIRNANQYTSCDVGMCLQYVRTWFDIQAGTPDATTAWQQAYGKHPGDRNPPRGAPLFWTGGSAGHGHIALAKGLNNSNQVIVRSTDVTYSGMVSDVTLPWFDQHWPGVNYAGWAEGFNGIWVPYLKNPPQGDDDWRSYGAVYVTKLERGQQDSDSVSRLRYRLTNHNKMPDNKKPGYGAGYGPDCQEAVKYWQNSIADPSNKGPRDGSSVSNDQANRLFGDRYTVIEE